MSMPQYRQPPCSWPDGYQLVTKDNYVVKPGDLVWSSDDCWTKASISIGRRIDDLSIRYVASLQCPDGYKLCYDKDYVIDKDDLWFCTCEWHAFADSKYAHRIGGPLSAFSAVVAIPNGCPEKQEQKGGKNEMPKVAKRAPEAPRGYRLVSDPHYTICAGDLVWTLRPDEWCTQNEQTGRILSATGYDFAAKLEAPNGYELCYNGDHVINPLDMWWDVDACLWGTFDKSEFDHHIGLSMRGCWKVIAVSREWLREQEQKESEAKVAKETTTKAIETTTTSGLAAIVPDIKEGLKLSAGKAAAEACSALVWESAKRVGIERPVVFPQRDVELLVVSVLAQFALEAAKTVTPDNQYLPKAQRLASLATTACAKDSADFIRGVLLTDVVEFAKKLVERVHLDGIVDERK